MRHSQPLKVVIPEPQQQAGLDGVGTVTAGARRRNPSLRRWIALLLCCGLQNAAFPAAAPWQTWKCCTLVPHPNNDGDSFRIQHGTNVILVRLYGVDCPETKLAMKQRIEDQRRHWKLADAVAVVALGMRAADFTRTNLLAAPFTVRTRGTHVYGGPRVYGQVTLGDGRKLEALLLKARLARKHGLRGESP